MEEEEERGGSPWDGKKQKPKCVINIFCHEKKPSDMAWDNDDDSCVINIFCDDKKHHGPDCDKDEPCIINVFCKNKKPDGHCDKEKW